MGKAHSEEKFRFSQHVQDAEKCLYIAQQPICSTHDTYANVRTTGTTDRVDGRDEAVAAATSWRATRVDLEAILSGISAMSTGDSCEVESDETMAEIVGIESR